MIKKPTKCLLQQWQRRLEFFLDRSPNSATIERTEPLQLSQDDKIWIVAGNRGAAIRDTLQLLAADAQPVRPIVLLLSTSDPSQRDLLDQFLANRPAITERVFLLPIGDVDERLLLLKSEMFADDALTGLARSLLYSLASRTKLNLNDRFKRLVDQGVVVRPLFRDTQWKVAETDLAELWLFLAADSARTLTDAEQRFGQSAVARAREALDSNRPTRAKPTTELVDHDATPPRPLWPAGLARMVDLLKDGATAKSVEWLARRFFGSGGKPRDIIEQMLQWLQLLGLVVRTDNDTFRVVTRGDVEQAAQAAWAWHDGEPVKPDILVLDGTLLLPKEFANSDDSEVQRDYTDIARTAGGFWTGVRDQLFPWKTGGMVIVGLPQAKRIGEPLRSIAQGRGDAVIDPVAADLVRSAALRGRPLDEGAAARIMASVLWPEQRSAAFAYSGLGLDRRTEPQVLHRELDVASFHYRSGLRAPPQQVEVVGGRSWTSEGLDRLAERLIEATPFDQPDAVPLPLWVIGRQFRDISRIEWLRKYQEDVFHTLRSGELDNVWLRGWEPEGA